MAWVVGAYLCCLPAVFPTGYAFSKMQIYQMSETSVSLYKEEISVPSALKAYFSNFIPSFKRVHRPFPDALMLS